MGARRYALSERDEARLTRAAVECGGRLLNVLADPRALVFGAADWQARFVIGSHVELSAHDVDALAAALAARLSLGPASPARASAPERAHRPRLAASIEPRIHVREGRATLQLNDPRARRARVVDARTWAALRFADGTRDRDALRLAAGGRLQLDEVEDLLEDGLPSRAPPPPSAPPAPRRLETLPGFRLRCDGRGGCCGAYGAVPFTAAEAALAAERGATGVDPDLLFTPLSGSDRARLAVAQVDDACAFLSAGGRCDLHAWRGAGAKPLACRLYPTTLVDDGVAVRASVAPECACVFDSADAPGTDALVEDGLAVDALARALPELVPVAPGRATPRAVVRAFADRLWTHLAREPRDLAAFAAGLAGAVERRGLEGLDADALERVELVEARVPRDAASRLAAAADDLTRAAAARRVARWASRSAAVGDEPPAAPHPARERFYLRALTYGHRLATDGATLADGLRQRSRRLALARAMGRVDADGARSPAYPLAALEGALRHLGLTL